MYSAMYSAMHPAGSSGVDRPDCLDRLAGASAGIDAYIAAAPTQIHVLGGQECPPGYRGPAGAARRPRRATRSQRGAADGARGRLTATWGAVLGDALARCRVVWRSAQHLGNRRSRPCLVIPPDTGGAMIAATTVARRASRHLDGVDVASPEGLLFALALVDVGGWDSHAGRSVLEYARVHVVRPVVRSVGFTGADLMFAEATGWEISWETLAGRSVRRSNSPWGVVWSAVRRAVLGERLANVYGTGAWSAWRIHRRRDDARWSYRSREHGDWAGVADPAALAEPISLSRLVECGYEPAAPGPGYGSVLGERLKLLVDLLVRHGWPREEALVVVEHVALSAVGNGTESGAAPGWRRLAATVDLPLWQARRVTVLLLGAPGWPGLVERLVIEGPDALGHPAVHSAVRATLDESMRPPARVARAVAARIPRTEPIAS